MVLPLPSLLFGKIVSGFFFLIVPKGVFIFFVIDYVIGIVRFIFIFIVSIFLIKTVMFISFGIVKHRRHLPSKIFLKFFWILHKNSSAKYPVFLL